MNGWSLVYEGFVPAQDKYYLVGIAQLPDAASLDRTEAVVRHMTDILLAEPGVENVVAFSGLSISGFASLPNAAVVFAMCYWFVDVMGWRKWTKPLAIYGMNAIAAYMLADLIGTALELIKIGGSPLKRVIYTNVFTPLADLYTASMLYGLAFSFTLFLLAWFMYRRNWFLRF